MSGASCAVVAALILIGATAMWIYRGTVLKAPIPIGTLVLALLVGFLGFAHSQVDDRRKAHDLCVERVSRSLEDRTMWVDLGTYLAKQGLTEAAAWVQQTLDQDLPILLVGDCPQV